MMQSLKKLFLMQVDDMTHDDEEYSLQKPHF